MTRSISRVGIPCPRTTSRVGVAPRSRAASRAAAATPLTVGTVITSRRSQRATTSTTRASLERGRSTTTRSWPRLAAESASRTANGCTEPLGPGGQVSTPRPSRRGTASCNERALSRPVVCCSASQRTPSRCSSPRTRSRPGPSGSRSTTIAEPRRAPTWPSAQAKVVAPAPPLPPTTPTTRPRLGARSPASVSTSTSHASERGSSATLSAPTDRAIANRSSGTGPATTTWVASRRPGRSRAISAATSAPRRTSGAADQAASASVTEPHTRGVTPAAAASRSSSSSSDASRVTTSGALMPSTLPRAAGHERVADVPGDTGCRSVACGHPPGRSAPGGPAALLR